MGLLSDFAGGQNLHFFHILPPYIKRSVPPGYSPLPAPTFKSWVVDALMLRHVWASPNFVWAVLALAVYFAFPYDLSSGSIAAAAPLSWAFFRARFPIWYASTVCYPCCSAPVVDLDTTLNFASSLRRVLQVRVDVRLHGLLARDVVLVEVVRPPLHRSPAVQLGQDGARPVLVTLGCRHLDRV